MREKSKRKKQTRQLTFLFYKELFLAGLAIVSVYFVFYEYLHTVSDSTVAAIQLFELLVACIFLTDFSFMYAKSPDKKTFLRKNWYLYRY